MKLRLGLLLTFLLLGLGTLLVTRHHSAVPHAPAPAKPTASVSLAATPASALTRILAERDDVRRLQQLSAWVDAHTLQEIGTSVASLPDADKRPVNELVILKLRDLSATLSPTVFTLQEWSYFNLSTGGSLYPPSLSDSLLTLAETDPVAAFHQAVKTRLLPEDRERTMIKILGLLALKDPHQALALLRQTRSLNQQEARRIIAENWTTSDPQAALAWALTQPVTPLQRLTEIVLNAWSQKDPAAALEAATTLPPGRLNDSTTQELLKRWFLSSPQESIAWIKDQPNPGALILKSAVASLGRTHPQEAAALLDKPLSASARRNCTQALIYTWANSDPLAASR